MSLTEKETQLVNRVRQLVKDRKNSEQVLIYRNIPMNHIYMIHM
jgi:hypothetical protein